MTAHTVRPILIALGLLGLAACANTPPPRADARRPTDVGEMAYPAPLPSGNVKTTVTR